MNLPPTLRPVLTLVLATLPALNLPAQQGDNPFVRTLPASGELRLEMVDLLRDPLYLPPRSVVSYPVGFETADNPQPPVLRDGAGKIVDFQLSEERAAEDGTLRFARLHLLADPPAAGKKNVFVLERGDGGQSHARPLFAWQGQSTLHVHTGSQIVTLPNLDAPPAAEQTVPGPLQALDLGSGAIGASRLHPGKRKLESITTRRSAHGPLFTEYEVGYTFDNGGSYRARLRALRETPFVELSESISGLAPEDGVRVTLELADFLQAEGANREVSPSSPHSTASRLDGQTVSLFCRRDNDWAGGAAPVRISPAGDADQPLAIVWELAAPRSGQAAERHIGIALHDVAGGLARIANHPPGHYPNSSDTFASWLYHYHQELPLDATKDWQLSAEGAEPRRLFDAYHIARRREVGRYRELAATAAAAPGHPMAAEWLAQAATAPPQLPAKREPTVALGELSLQFRDAAGAGKGANRREVLTVADAYHVFVDRSDAPGARFAWGGGEAPPRLLVAGAQAGQLLTAQDGTLVNETPSDRSLAVAATEGVAVNGRTGSPGLNAVPAAVPLLVESAQRSDQIFVPAEGERLSVDGEGWEFDGELGLICKRPQGAGVALASFAISGTKAVNRVTAGGFSLETEGESTSASAILAALPDPAAEPAPFTVAGHYHSEGAGTLRLRFGEAQPAVQYSTGSLLAFWKFDEAAGRSLTNTKALDRPAQIVGGRSEPARVKGVGFGEVYALALDGTAHIETFFDTPLPESSTTAIWVKTTRGGSLWTKSALQNGQPVPGSRWLHIDARGHAVATLVAGNAGELAVLTADQKLADNKWHHIVWVSAGDAHQLVIDGKLAAETTVATPPSPRAVLRVGAAARLPQAAGEPKEVANFAGAIDELRVYLRDLNSAELAGIYQVGARLAPIVITSQPKQTLRVGEVFEYSLEFTGAPFVTFQIIGLPSWLGFQGRITGTPGAQDIGTTKSITIAGACPWGPAQQRFRIEVLPPLVASEWKLYVDGRPVPTRYVGYGIEADLPPGSGGWQFTNKQPVPDAPAILHAAASKEGAEVLIRPSAGAENYLVELSGDGGASWKPAADGKSTRHQFETPPPGDYLLRAIARNADHTSAPSATFDLAIGEGPPAPPRAPRVIAGKDSAEVAWEPVAGAASYTLYRRQRGSAGTWQPVYSGRGTQYHDRAATGAIPAFPARGYLANAARDMSGVTIYEYAVSATNANGESERSPAANTDPRNW